MNVEILKLANGYMVRPDNSYNYNQDRTSWDKIYIFRNYQELVDKLQEILERPEPK